MPKGIFHDLIVEEYENSSRKTFDVVGTKRTSFKDLMNRANDHLNVAEYEKAKELYSQVLKLLQDDPYPDEYDFEEDTVFYLKCCFCYCNIHSYKNVDDGNKTMVNSIEQYLLTLIESYPNQIMPYYLKLLFDSRKPNTLSSILMCILLQTIQYQNSQLDVIIPKNTVFNKLLPNMEEIMEFQQKIYTTKLKALTKSDFKKVLKFCRTSNRSKNMSVQTDKPKLVNKYLQTDLKTFRNAEVQVSLDVIENKKKIFELERTYKEAAVVHDKRLRDLQMQINASKNEHQKLKEEMENQLEAYRSEITQLKEALAKSQAQTAVETRKNEKLQKLILDLIEQKFALRKQLHDGLGEKGKYLITYLSELLLFLSPTSVPSDTAVRNEIEYWNMKLLVNTRNLDILISTYRSEKSKLIQSSCSETCTTSFFRNWPDVPQCLRDSESVVYNSFKLLLNHIVELETNLEEMRNNYKGFLNYAQSQCDSPWMTNKRKFQSSITDSPSHVGMNPILPMPTYAAINPGFCHFSSMHVSTVYPSREWFNNSFNTVPHYPEIPGTYQTTVAMNPQINAGNSAFSRLQPANPSNRIPSGNFNPVHPQSTNAHPEPLSSPSTGPLHNKQGSDNQSSNKKKCKNRLSTSPKAADGEQASTSSEKSVHSTMQNSARSNVQNLHASAIPGPSHSCVSHLTTKPEGISDEVSTSEGAVGGGLIHDDKILFHYVYENCPGFSEERITLAMLKALDDFGGSFDNIPRQQILDSIKVLLHTTPMFFDDISEQCCSICFEENSKSPLHTLSCQHIYHERCIQMWFKRSNCCPICRKPSTIATGNKK